MINLILLFYFLTVYIKANVPVCEMGIIGKCLRDPLNEYVSGVPKPDAELLFTSPEPNFDSCAHLCNQNLNCFMSGFDTSNNMCSLYKHISYYRITSKISISLWHCCNTNNSYPATNRCPGFWKRKSHSLSDNIIRPSDPLIEFRGITEYQCQMECLNNAICGASNSLSTNIYDINDVTCQLIIQFPVESLILINKTDWHTFQWQCASNYSLPSPSKECTPRLNYPRGHWIMQNTSMILNDSIDLLINFYTMDYRQCLANCALYDHCSVAWYSPQSYYCALEANKAATCGQKSKGINYTFTTYSWQSCYPLYYPMPKSDSQGITCRTLIDNMYTYIYPIRCGQLPNNISNLYPCWNDLKAPHGTVYSDNLHCRSNQTFQVFDELQQPPFRGANVAWRRAFTGYESFWLVNVTENNFPTTNNDVCDIFDASMDVSGFQALTIINRSEWFSSKPTHPERLFPDHPVEFVIISDTESPYCNCFSFSACSSILRLLQIELHSDKFYSLPYSFIVTGDGLAYEARGFDFEPQVATAEYNSNSFAIALCGRYRHTPNVKALSAVKQLIQKAVLLKKVSPNYTLYIYNDLRDRIYPYEGLRRVIELWPHYRGHIRQNCCPISNVIIWINIVLMIVCCTSIVLTVHRFVYKLWHQKHCYSVKDCRIETVYCNLLTKSVEILPQIVMHNINDLLWIERYLSSVTSPFFWIEDCSSALSQRQQNQDQCSCRSAIFSMFYLCRLRSQLVNVSSILLLPELRSCSQTVAFIFQRSRELEKECLIIVHVRRKNSLYKFITYLHQNKCICDNFKIIQYNGQLEYSGSVFRVMEGSMYSVTKNCRIRNNLQEKYTYIIDSNNTLRYF